MGKGKQEKRREKQRRDKEVRWSFFGGFDCFLKRSHQQENGVTPTFVLTADVLFSLTPKRNLVLEAFAVLGWKRNMLVQIQR